MGNPGGPRIGNWDLRYQVGNSISKLPPQFLGGNVVTPPRSMEWEWPVVYKQVQAEHATPRGRGQLTAHRAFSSALSLCTAGPLCIGYHWHVLYIPTLTRASCERRHTLVRPSTIPNSSLFIVRGYHAFSFCSAQSRLGGIGGDAVVRVHASTQRRFVSSICASYQQ